MERDCAMKISIAAFSLAFGIWWGVGVFLLTWWFILKGIDAGSVSILQITYIGYSISPLGSFVGLVWGFFDGAICGAVLAWLYNMLADRFGSHSTGASKAL